MDVKSINAGVAQLVERQPSKLNVAGSNPVSRSKDKFLILMQGEKFIPSEVEGNPVSRSKVIPALMLSLVEVKAGISSFKGF